MRCSRARDTGRARDLKAFADPLLSDYRYIDYLLDYLAPSKYSLLGLGWSGNAREPYPVAGIPHGGFYEGGRAQEANSFKARPYPPPG